MTQKKRMNATKKADALFGASVRARGKCEMAPLFPAITCNGNLQCAHIVSRRYRALRWDVDNALCGCQAHHMYYTMRPLEWEEACVNAGILYRALRVKALEYPPMDPHAVIARLSEDRP